MIGKLILSLAIFCIAIATPSMAGNFFYGTVKKVIDGDSLVIVSGKLNIEVRLYGVDCPEYDQQFSKDAKAFVRTRFLGRKVVVQPQYHDAYKRLVAIISSGEQTVNGQLVQAGLAWVYPHYCRKDVCKSWQKMERSAKKYERGIWSGTQPPMPPWEWKRRKHSR